MPVVTEHSRRSAGPIAREFQINDFGWRRSSLQGLKNSQVVDANRRRFGPLELSAPRETAPGVEVFWTYASECGNRRKVADRKPLRIKNLELEAPPGFEPGIEVLQLGTLPHSPREYIHLLTIHRVRLVPNSAQYGWMVPN